jgi:hypothetical protein
VGKLKRRYSKEEFAILSACIKPYERWTIAERKSWARTCYGFRQFAAPNITSIEHYRPETETCRPLMTKTTTRKVVK